MTCTVVITGKLIWAQFRYVQGVITTGINWVGIFGKLTRSGQATTFFAQVIGTTFDAQRVDVVMCLILNTVPGHVPRSSWMCV